MSEDKHYDIPGSYPENATGGEYERALDVLGLASEDNLENYTRLELENYLKPIIRSLAVVIQNNYALEEKKREDGTVYDQGYVLNAPIGEESFFAMTGDMPGSGAPEMKTEFYTILLNKSIRQGAGYIIQIPTDGDFSNYVITLSATHVTPDGKTMQFVPESDDPNMIKEYFRVLQTGIKDLLTVARKPTKIPPELEEQF